MAHEMMHPIPTTEDVAQGVTLLSGPVIMVVALEMELLVLTAGGAVQGTALLPWPLVCQHLRFLPRLHNFPSTGQVKIQESWISSTQPMSCMLCA